MRTGRPSGYNDDLIIKICAEIATSSKSMKTICNELEVPVGTVLDWLSKHKDFSEKYARAKEMQADYMSEEILGIADDSRNDTEMRYDTSGKPFKVENKEWINRSRLRVDTRKWLASKLKPKKYGDRIEFDGKIENPSLLSPEVAAAIAQKLNIANTDISG